MKRTKLDLEKICKVLGAEHISSVPTGSGYFGALQTLAAYRAGRACLIDAFFAHEAQKPAHLRQNYCHIYCPCHKCNPATL